MNNNQLNRVMRLVRRTGDRCVVLDNENDDAVVVMNLDEYENLLDCDGNTCSCCDDLEENNEDEEENDDEDIDEDDDEVWPILDPELSVHSDSQIHTKDEAIHFEAEEAEEVENVAPIMEEMMVGLPDLETKNFANVGQEESLKDLPSEEADRFYLEPVDE